MNTETPCVCGDCRDDDHRSNQPIAESLGAIDIREELESLAVKFKGELLPRLGKDSFTGLPIYGEDEEAARRARNDSYCMNLYYSGTTFISFSEPIEYRGRHWPSDKVEEFMLRLDDNNSIRAWGWKAAYHD